MSDTIFLQVRRVLVPLNDDGVGVFTQSADETLTGVTDFNQNAVQAIFVSVIPEVIEEDA